MATFGVILVAAGKSSRFNDEVKKPYADIDGRAVWLRAADLFINRKDVIQTILVIAEEDEENVRRRYGPNMAFMNVILTLGGTTRSDSVTNGLAKLQPDIQYVAIHDAVRPCATPEMIDKVFSTGQETGAAILAAPIVDTLKRDAGNTCIESTMAREHLWLAQTPQVFFFFFIEKAYASRKKESNLTDDAQLVEMLGVPVSLVTSDASNIKITTKSDLYLADAILKSRPKPKSRAFHPFAEEDMWK